MTIPSVDIVKADFATGSVGPDPTGVLAILAASQTGTVNVAASYARDDLALNDFGVGPLVEYGSYDLQVAKKPVVLVKGAASVAATYAGLDTSKVTGTSAVTTGGTTPLDEYEPLIVWVSDCTIGVAGGTYRYSLDGGDSFSGVQALGTANSITIPKSGVSFNLGAGTLKAGDQWTCFTTRPLCNDVDVAAGLEALRVTRLPWEGAFIDSQFGTGTVGICDTWLQGQEAVGQFHFILLNTRHKTQPVPTAETETAYATAMTTATAQSASIRCCVGVDAADYTSTMTGWSQPRPTAMFLAARAMLIPIGEDPAFVARGAIPGATIADGKGNPRWHDEDLYPSLDAQRLVTLRSFSNPGPQGVYICNANVISPSGSDYIWLQHVRTMNRACSIVWQILTGQLSIGVATKPADPQTGAVYIQEKDAARIDALCNSALATPMKGQVTAVQSTMSRTDDLSSNSSSTAHATLQLVSLKYLKKFVVQSTFTKTIAVAA